MAQVVAVRFHGAERDSTQSVDFQHVLLPAGGGDHEDVAFFAHADLVADAVEDLPLLEGVQREVVQAAVGEAVAVVCWGCEKETRG